MTRWLYRLQQRLSITGPEAALLLSLSGLLLLGVVVREVQAHQPAPYDAAFYAPQDARFAALALANPTPALAAMAPAPPAVAPDTTRRTRSAARARTEARAEAERPVRMNINTANARLLERLPGIGPAMAQRILEHREAHGPFRSVRALLDVRGIGEKKLADLEPYVFVEGGEAVAASQ